MTIEEHLNAVLFDDNIFIFSNSLEASLQAVTFWMKKIFFIRYIWKQILLK